LGAMVASRGRSDDAGQAAIMGGLSLIQQRAINFTRYDEIEADRVGIQTLAKAGYDPLAMADTFSMFQRVMRTNGVDIPEFLRTHPVDVNRIADAKARAVALAQNSSYVAPGAARAIDPIAAANDAGCAAVARIGDRDLGESRSTACQTAPRLSLSIPPTAMVHLSRGRSDGEQSKLNYFELMRERERTLNADSPNAIVRYYGDELRTNPAANTPANRYGHALALLRARQAADAASEFGKLVAEYPTSPVFALGMAAAEEQAGSRTAALKRFEELNEDFPGNRAISIAYADALLAHADGDAAQRAQNLLRPLLARHAEDPELQRSFARAAELGGDKVRAAEAYAEVTFLNGRAEDALNQLKSLSKETELSYYQRARVDARITAMTPIVLDLRKRGIQAGSEDKEGLAPASSCRHRTCLQMSSQRNIAPLQ
ncbi:MAG: M48 family metalloprotease, partial [Dokdonella sp.]